MSLVRGSSARKGVRGVWSSRSVWDARGSWDSRGAWGARGFGVKCLSCLGIGHVARDCVRRGFGRDFESSRKQGVTSCFQSSGDGW